MLQPMVSLSASTDASAIDSTRTDATSGFKADELRQDSEFDRLMSDYRSADKQVPAMKELAAGVQDASNKSGESSPPLPLSGSDSDPLEKLGDNESLMSYLMANSGAESVAVSSDSALDTQLINPSLAAQLETDPEALLETDRLELTVVGDGEADEQTELSDGAVLLGANATVQGQQPGLTDVTNAKSAEASLSQSRLAGEVAASEQALKNATNTVDAAKQNLTTSQSTQALGEDAVVEQGQQMLSQQNMKDSARQAEISQGQMLAQQGAEADELIDAGLEKNLRTPADMQHASNAQAKNQPSIDLQNIQQADQLNRPLKLVNAATALSERIQTMISSNTQSATVRLDPPELGSMEIRVQVKNDQAHVQIVTSSSQTREALEQQSARLREVLVDQGLNLSNLDVSDQQTQQRSGSGESGSGQQGDGLASDTELADEPEQVVSTTLGYVDHYV